jgi:hypothetical protein
VTTSLAEYVVAANADVRDLDVLFVGEPDSMTRSEQRASGARHHRNGGRDRQCGLSRDRPLRVRSLPILHREGARISLLVIRILGSVSVPEASARNRLSSSGAVAELVTAVPGEEPEFGLRAPSSPERRLAAPKETVARGLGFLGRLCGFLLYRRGALHSFGSTLGSGARLPSRLSVASPSPDGFFLDFDATGFVTRFFGLRARATAFFNRSPRSCAAAFLNLPAPLFELPLPSRQLAFALLRRRHEFLLSESPEQGPTGLIQGRVSA